MGFFDFLATARLRWRADPVGNVCTGYLSPHGATAVAPGLGRQPGGSRSGGENLVAKNN
jgi:hypothetical protein